ncbi:MAG: hypothetical protein L3J18_00520 [Candidatus Brocadia sp.]|nr:MAG: hypothetical protein L3J18_00520 [Candidatus Brocadia sp.]
MGATLCTESITVEFGCQIRVELKDGSLESILKAFCKILPEILRDFIQKIVVGSGESAMARSLKPFCCDECGKDKGFIWKTRHGKETKILTVFQWLRLERMFTPGKTHISVIVSAIM